MTSRAYIQRPEVGRVSKEHRNGKLPRRFNSKKNVVERKLQSPGDSASHSVSRQTLFLDTVMKQLLRNKVLPLMLCAALLPSCSTGRSAGSSASSAPTSELPALSNRDIIRAVLFNVGEGSKRLNSLQANSGDPATLAAVDQVIDMLERDTPGFIESFANEMRSKDRYSIQLAFIQAAEKLDDLLHIEQGNECGVAVVCVAAFAAAVHNVAVATSVAVAAAVAAVAAAITLTVGANGTDVTLEEYVDDIASAF